MRTYLAYERRGTRIRGMCMFTFTRAVLCSDGSAVLMAVD